MLFQLTPFKNLTPVQQSKLFAKYSKLLEAGVPLHTPYVTVDDLYVSIDDIRNAVMERKRTQVSGKQILWG